MAGYPVGADPVESALLGFFFGVLLYDRSTSPVGGIHW